MHEIYPSHNKEMLDKEPRFVYQGKVYEVWKRYIDLDNDRAIFTIFESRNSSEIIPESSDDTSSTGSTEATS